MIIVGPVFVNGDLAFLTLLPAIVRVFADLLAFFARRGGNFGVPNWFRRLRSLFFRAPREEPSFWGWDDEVLSEIYRLPLEEARLVSGDVEGMSSAELKRELERAARWKQGAYLEKDDLRNEVRKLQECWRTPCAICLEEWSDGTLARRLPCGHRFHCECIDRWLAKGSRRCPNCNQHVISGRGSASGRSGRGSR